MAFKKIVLILLFTIYSQKILAFNFDGVRNLRGGKIIAKACFKVGDTDHIVAVINFADSAGNESFVKINLKKICCSDRSMLLLKKGDVLSNSPIFEQLKQAILNYKTNKNK